MKKFYTADCPETTTISAWLKKQTEWVDLMRAVKPAKKYPTVMAFNIDNFSPSSLADSILEATTIYGDHGWRSAQGSNPGYTGFSLVYNPAHQDNLDIHASTLGTPKNNRNEFFWNNTQNHEILKNSYFDGYGFNTPTPASQHGELGVFMERCKRTRVRSRLSIINGGAFNDDPNKENRWHKDEPVFENLRINIPITTNENYFFQIENQERVHLPVGHAYSWNTFIPHTVFNTKLTDSRRIHLVMGFSPWWDYLPEEQAWVQNEFYGVKHPFDMLDDGDVFSGLTLDTNTKIYD